MIQSRLNIVLVSELVDLIQPRAREYEGRVVALGHAQLRIRVIVALLPLTVPQAHLYYIGFKSTSIFLMLWLSFVSLKEVSERVKESRLL